MNDFQKAHVLGILINSGLFLTGAFVAGMVTDNPLAWKAALASAAFCYFSYIAQYMGAPPPAPQVAVWLSIVTGAVAGIVLLFDIRWP